MTTNLELDIAYHHGRCEGAIEMLPPGPWSQEPHRIEFKHEGFDCLLKRASMTLVWCGYVAVKPDHPYYKKGYDEIEGLDAPGGLTYAASCNTVICHKSEETDDKVWWLGFDCSHCDDFVPGTEFKKVMGLHMLEQDESEIKEIFKELMKMEKSFGIRDKHYWTVSEVTEVTKELANQLRKVANDPR